MLLPMQLNEDTKQCMVKQSLLTSAIPRMLEEKDLEGSIIINEDGSCGIHWVLKLEEEATGSDNLRLDL